MYKRIEEFSLNAWPALQSFVYDGWLMRFADGYTKRSNSINPIYSCESLVIKDKIKHCESIYSIMKLDTVFKITPFATADLDLILEDMNYEIVEPSYVKLLNLSVIDEPRNSNVTITTMMTDEWAAILAEFNNLAKSKIQITRQLLTNSYLEKGFFTLYEGDTAVACGIGVIEQNYVGLLDIVTAPLYRNKGYGKQLILNILNWAKQRGVTDSYLQVVQNNEFANKLYDHLGYREAYTYWYRRKTLQ